MPRLIDRKSALARLDAPSSCVPCAWVSRPRALAESEHAVALLTPYPVRWGHVLVVLRAHRLRLEEATPEEWADASLLAHAAGRAVERALNPARCYVAALGTSEPDLPMTFQHLHFHVIPVEEAGARPADVLTWRHGIYEGTDAEWDAMFEALRAAWPG